MSGRFQPNPKVPSERTTVERCQARLKLVVQNIWAYQVASVRNWMRISHLDSAIIDARNHGWVPRESLASRFSTYVHNNETKLHVAKNETGH